jgi:NADH-quinone oxidoreductase subunit M
LLVDGAVELYSPVVGAAVVIAAALNGIAIMRAYFMLFTGTRYVSSVSLKANRRERFAVLCLTGILVAGGLFPQYNVAARFQAASKVLQDRHKNKLDKDSSLPQAFNLVEPTQRDEASLSTP